MKRTAQKTPQLSTVPSASAPEGRGQDSADSLKDFFSGWLDSVAPQIAERPQERVPAHTSGYRGRRISSTDIVRLNRATVRESTDHRHWPPEVVAHFLSAEVITRKNKRS